MITKHQHNEALRKARRERALSVRDKFMEYDLRSNKDYKPVYKRLSEEERQAIRKQVRKEYRTSQLRSIAVFIGAILLIVFVCILIL